MDWILALYFEHEIENHIYEVKDVNNVKAIADMDGDLLHMFMRRSAPQVRLKEFASLPLVQKLVSYLTPSPLENLSLFMVKLHSTSEKTYVR